MKSAGLRRTLQVPTNDSDEDDVPLAMDEEEQEKLIQKLRNEDDKRNQLYKRLFLTISIVAAVSFLPTLALSPLLQAKLVCLLGMSSICTSAYALTLIPSGRSEQDVRGFGGMGHSGPPMAYLVPLNGALSAFLGIEATLMRPKQGVHEGFWLLCLLPLCLSDGWSCRGYAHGNAGIFVLIEIGRRVMSSAHIEELEKLRYKYKGA